MDQRRVGSASGAVKTGVLLVNLGTPAAPTASACRRYLKEFLSDSRVVEIPRWIWWPLLNLWILQRRPRKSAAAYRSIWLDEGSPLMMHSRQLATALQESLAEQDIQVELAMRYGAPAMTEALEKLRKAGVRRILVLPLYPQYAAATTASVFDKLVEILRPWRHLPSLSLISDYHDDPAYIQAMAEQIAEYRAREGDSGFLLFSFHGLPDRSRRLGDPYYDQCLRSARLIAECLGLDESQWKVAFQSRFGRAKWLQPYCVDVLRQLAEEGILALDVVCPGFAVDCLETLEEIDMLNRRLFQEAGGARYRYIPALNASAIHTHLLADLIRRQLG